MTIQVTVQGLLYLLLGIGAGHILYRAALACIKRLLAYCERRSSI